MFSLMCVDCMLSVIFRLLILRKTYTHDENLPCIEGEGFQWTTEKSEWMSDFLIPPALMMNH
jgi:hypothetical protein